jgi:hypothetical protein
VPDRRNAPIAAGAGQDRGGDKPALGTYCEFAYLAGLPRRSTNGLVLHSFHSATDERLGFGRGGSELIDFRQTARAIGRFDYEIGGRW